MTKRNVGQRTHATTPTAVLSLVVATTSFSLAWVKHSRSNRPSPLPDAYLFFPVLFDVARARTLWLIMPHSAIASIFIASMVARSTLAVLKSYSKPVTLQSDIPSKEEISGTYSRSMFFFWLSSLFVIGYKHVLTLEDLYPLDAKLKTKKPYSNFQTHGVNASIKFNVGYVLTNWHVAWHKNEKVSLVKVWAASVLELDPTSRTTFGLDRFQIRSTTSCK